ncbi:hypothetical protein [Halpernia sp.]
MTIFYGNKGVFDSSVFTASAAPFALDLKKDKCLKVNQSFE